jgi:fatty acid desaturase
VITENGLEQQKYPEETPEEISATSKSDLKKAVITLSRLEPWKWVAWALADWTVMIGAVAVAGRINHWAVYIICTWIIGTRQHALGVLGHEGVHRLISRNRKLNDRLCAALCFWPLATSMDAWKQFHLEHHRNVGTEDDPEIVGKRAISPRFDTPTRRSTITLYFLLDLFGVGVINHAKFREATPFLNLKDPLDKQVMRIVLFGSVLLLIVSGFWWVIPMWFGGLVTAALAGIRMRLWFEHVGADDTHRWHLPLLLRPWLPHNIWYHYEHHKFPAVPFYNLPALRRLDDSEPVISLDQVLTLIENHHAPRASILSTDAQ